MAIIYAIPGFACTEKLFEKFELKGHRLQVLKWPEPLRQYNLKDYAAKFAEQIDQSQKFYLLGVSFGGMLCAELNELLNPEKTILISSAKNRDELPWPVRMLKFIPIQKLFSEGVLRWMAAHSRWIIGISKDLMPDFIAMMKVMPDQYFRCCVNYIINWERRTNSKKIFHIHGKADRLLWFGSLRNVDFSIPEAGHGMIIYQAHEISQIVNSLLNDMESLNKI